MWRCKFFSHRPLVPWEVPFLGQRIKLAAVHPDGLSYTWPKPTWWKQKTQLTEAVLWPPPMCHGTHKKTNSLLALLCWWIMSHFWEAFSWFLYYKESLQPWGPEPMGCFSKALSQQHFLFWVITHAFCTLDWNMQSHNSLQSQWSLDWSQLSEESPDLCFEWQHTSPWCNEWVALVWCDDACL